TARRPGDSGRAVGRPRSAPTLRGRAQHRPARRDDRRTARHAGRDLRDRRRDEARAVAGERGGGRLGAEPDRRGGAAGAPLISDAGDGDVDVLRELLREYAAWLGPQVCFTDLEAELAALPGNYDALLVASREGEAVGCVALKPLADGACEMKRLYVPRSGRGVRDEAALRPAHRAGVGHGAGSRRGVDGESP